MASWRSSMRIVDAASAERIVHTSWMPYGARSTQIAPLVSSVKPPEDDPFAVELGGGLLIDHTVTR